MAAAVFDPNETVIYLARPLVVPFNMVAPVFAEILTTIALVYNVISIVSKIYGAMKRHIGKCGCQCQVTNSQFE